MSVFENRLVWLNGPFPASRHDITIFREDGLLDQMPAGHLAIADKGYRGEPNVVATANSRDQEPVRALKGAARARQESFNARIKVFKCLDERFRHQLKKHKVAVEAVCVIVQYQLENGSPLFSV